MSSTSISSSDSAILNVKQKAGPRGMGYGGWDCQGRLGDRVGRGKRAVDQFAQRLLIGKHITKSWRFSLNRLKYVINVCTFYHLYHNL